ncbi:MAG: hypothetical protein CMQ14_06520 [Gammaproteobacteria bacterium]|nr:hypothetical protein [Gammaproteobacteria bacterium]
MWGSDGIVTERGDNRAEIFGNQPQDVRSSWQAWLINGLLPCFLTSRQGCSKEQNEGFESGHLDCNFPRIIWAGKAHV